MCCVVDAHRIDPVVGGTEADGEEVGVRGIADLRVVDVVIPHTLDICTGKGGSERDHCNDRTRNDVNPLQIHRDTASGIVVQGGTDILHSDTVGQVGRGLEASKSVSLEIARLMIEAGTSQLSRAGTKR